MNAYSLKTEKRKLLLRYLITIPAGVILVFVFPRFEQLTDLHLWYLLPAWVFLAHLSCALSNLITYRSLRSSWHLLRSTFLIYWKRTSFVHFQSAFLTALAEEMLFRYVLLNVLVAVTVKLASGSCRPPPEPFFALRTVMTSPSSNNGVTETSS